MLLELAAELSDFQSCKPVIFKIYFLDQKMNFTTEESIRLHIMDSYFADRLKEYFFVQKKAPTSFLFSFDFLLSNISTFIDASVNTDDSIWKTGEAWFWLNQTSKGYLLGYEDEPLAFRGVVQVRGLYAFDMGDGYLLMGEMPIQDVLLD